MLVAPALFQGRATSILTRLARVSGLIVIAVLALGFVALMWWSNRLRPTRPRYRSRYRGPTYLDIHDELKRRRRHP
jgi:di/tricarboxylate transporter